MLCCFLAGVVAAAAVCDGDRGCHRRCRRDRRAFDPEMNRYRCGPGCHFDDDPCCPKRDCDPCRCC